MVHQSVRLMAPITGVTRKHVRQPYMAAIQTKAGGPIIVATLEPALKMPVAKARSRLGNHSETALIAAGKLPLSPSPSMPRQKPSCVALPTVECSAAEMLHHPIETT